MPTIFDNIVTNENDHTQLICNLMDRSPKLAAILLSYLTRPRKILEEDAAKFNYQTQQNFNGPDGRQIPDIVVTGENLHCLIEVKIHPELGLTQGQKEGYRDCFDSKRKGNYLCFLVPNYWKHTGFVAQIVKPLQAHDVKVQLCYWQCLVSELDENLADTKDDLLKEAVSFLKWRFEIDPMTDEERNSLCPWAGEKFRAIRKLERTVDRVKKLFDAKQNYRTELETSPSYYGFYVKRDDSHLLWVGIWDEAPAPLSYGYELNRHHWLRPSIPPPGGATSRDGKYHLWELPADAWDKEMIVYQTIVSYLNTHLPTEKLGVD